MKRLLIVVTSARWGGAQKYVYDLCRGLSNSEFQIYIASGVNGPMTDALRDCGMEVMTVKMLTRNPGLRDDFFALVSLFQLIRAVRPDIVHLNSSKAAVLGVIAAKLFGIRKVIITSHGWPFLEPVSRIRQWIYKSIVSVAVALADHTITVSRTDFDAARTFPFLNPNRLHLIHNGVSRSDEWGDRMQIRERFISTHAPNGRSNRFWIGVIGELNQNKGQEVIIDQFTRYAPSHTELFLLGDGVDYEKLACQITRSSRKHDIHLVGHVSRASVVMKAFDLIAVPSLKEGLPYVILEAGLANVAVIAHNVGGIPDILTDMENGVLVDNENKSWRERLPMLIENESLRTRLAANLKHTVETRFQKRSMIKKVERLYLS